MKAATRTVADGVVITETNAEGAVIGSEFFANSSDDVVSGISVSPYVAPVINHRANALAALDPLVAQITRYEILGLSSDLAKAKLAAKVAAIDAEFPNV